jgi:hypothetical protein
MQISLNALTENIHSLSVLLSTSWTPVLCHGSKKYHHACDVCKYKNARWY